MNKTQITVSIHGEDVGTLEETKNHQVAFAYTPSWLAHGFPISPFSLPLRDGVFIAEKPYFDGLFGVFADSLPDAWGQLLTDCMLQKQGYTPSDVSPLLRLGIVGDMGLGALCYRPAWHLTQTAELASLDAMAQACQKLLRHEEIEQLDPLFAAGGSSGGSRPKVMTDTWIVKFPASSDAPDIGEMEEAYMRCAASCGIQIPEVRLEPSASGHGYFAIQRFDRLLGPDGMVHRRHMLTVAAILDLDWRTPSLDYHTLMQLTNILTRGDSDDLWQMYRRACFNVFAHNRDDHAKNFTFLYDDSCQHWRLAPAYDLTWSNT